MIVKTLKIAAQWLFILCIPVLLLTASVSLAMNSLWLYHYGFDKYNISQVTGLAPVELDKAARGLISYFNSSEEYIDVTVIKDGQPFTLFNEREVGHLKDVKGLFQLVYKGLMGSGAYAVVYVGVSLLWWRDKRLFTGLFGGGVLTLALGVALGLTIVLDFDQFFLEFHLLSFANDLWMLDPTKDYLIMLFPQGFWYDASAFCALCMGVLALVLGGVGWWLRKRKREMEIVDISQLPSPTSAARGR
jgi:integral membrane protein (TIGR01906 family)